MKTSTLKILLSKCRYYAIYGLSLLLAPIITACSSTRSAKKSATPEPTEAPSNPTKETASDSTSVFFDYRIKDNMQDLSRMRLLYGVQPPRRTPE
jgi:hypothetical protein